MSHRRPSTLVGLIAIVLGLTISCGGGSGSTPTPPPSVTSFTAASGTITLGQSTSVMPVFTNGIGAIDNGIGPVTSGSPVTVTPLADVTYHLTVSGTGAPATQAVTVNVVPPPVINGFQASSITITPGQSVLLTPDFIGGSGQVDHGVGVVASGAAVSVAPASTTTYTLTVSGTNGANATQALTITVSAAPVPPSITSFSASATTIVQGQKVILTPVFSAGTGAVDHGAGVVLSGISVTVTPGATTTYTLTVTGGDGVTTVTQAAPQVSVVPSAGLGIQVSWAPTINPGAYAVCVISDGRGFKQSVLMTGASGHPIVEVPAAGTYTVSAYPWVNTTPGGISLTPVTPLQAITVTSGTSAVVLQYH